ncbi:WXG100 family type VII secretion target [Spirillospora sp. NPDC029432]|uniref:WXG100 family type VII secretion target n=1 Tax=Spirillospora sp. NPDC029432 TaxID=3154599 RepID=UPI0034516647
MGQQSAQDREAMGQAAQEIENSAGIIKGLQTKLDGQKSQLMSGWQGAAAGSFDRVFNEFQTQMRKVLGELESMHGKLVDTKIQYEATEQEQEDAANKIASLLNGTT